MNRPTGLTDQVKMETDVSGVQYGPAGELKAITYFGNYETRTYNSMLQMTDLKIGSWAGWADLTNLHYTFPATQNNGRVTTTSSHPESRTNYARSESPSVSQSVSAATIRSRLQ